MVPKVLSGRCFMPSLNACRMRFLKSGRGWAAVTAAMRLRREIIAADAQDVGLHTGGDQSDFRLEEFGHARGGVQCDAQPDLASVGVIDAALQQEVARRVGAVDFEAQGRVRIPLGEAEVVEHRPDVEQLEVGLQPTAAALQRTEQEHSAGVVEQQVVLGIADEVGGLAHQRGVGDDDVGDVDGIDWVLMISLSVRTTPSIESTHVVGRVRQLLRRLAHRMRQNDAVVGECSARGWW